MKRRGTSVCVLFLIVLLSSLSFISAEILCNNDVVAYYPFDGNVSDYSSNHYNAIIVGNTTKFENNDFGKFLTFNGDNKSYLSLPKEVLDGSRAFSISLWVKSKSAKTGYLISAGNDRNGASFFLPDSEEFAILPFYEVNNGNNVKVPGIYLGIKGLQIQKDPNKGFDAKLNDGQWHNIILTLNMSENRIKVIIDSNTFYEGEINSVAERVKTNDVLNITRIFIGQRTSVSGQPVFNWGFNGSVEDLIVFNKILSNDESKEVFSKGVCGKFTTCKEERDNGKDPFMMGYSYPYILSGKKYNVSDYCFNDLKSAANIGIALGKYLREYSCRAISNVTSYEDYNCECGGCLKGSCRSSFSCIDYDNGDKPYNKSRVLINYTGGTSSSYNDFCFNDVNTKTILGINVKGKYVGEYVCDGYYQKMLYHECMYGCVNGACIVPKTNPRFCEDTDKGKNYFDKGYVLVNNFASTFEDYDKCVDGPRNLTVLDRSAFIMEYFCSAQGNLSFEIKDCNVSGGYICVRGKCAYNPSIAGQFLDEVRNANSPINPFTGNVISEIESDYSSDSPGIFERIGLWFNSLFASFKTTGMVTSVSTTSPQDCFPACTIPVSRVVVSGTPFRGGYLSSPPSPRLPPGEYCWPWSMCNPEDGPSDDSEGPRSPPEDETQNPSNPPQHPQPVKNKTKCQNSAQLPEDGSCDCEDWSEETDRCENEDYSEPDRVPEELPEDECYFEQYSELDLTKIPAVPSQQELVCDGQNVSNKTREAAKAVNEAIDYRNQILSDPTNDPEEAARAEKNLGDAQKNLGDSMMQDFYNNHKDGYTTEQEQEYIQKTLKPIYNEAIQSYQRAMGYSQIPATDIEAGLGIADTYRRFDKDTAIATYSQIINYANEIVDSGKLGLVAKDGLKYNPYSGLISQAFRGLAQTQTEQGDFTNAHENFKRAEYQAAGAVRYNPSSFNEIQYRNIKSEMREAAINAIDWYKRDLGDINDQTNYRLSKIAEVGNKGLTGIFKDLFTEQIEQAGARQDLTANKQTIMGMGWVQNLLENGYSMDDIYKKINSADANNFVSQNFPIAQGSTSATNIIVDDIKTAFDRSPKLKNLAVDTVIINGVELNPTASMNSPVLSNPNIPILDPKARVVIEPLPWNAVLGSVVTPADLVSLAVLPYTVTVGAPALVSNFVGASRTLETIVSLGTVVGGSIIAEKVVTDITGSSQIGILASAGIGMVNPVFRIAEGAGEISAAVRITGELLQYGSGSSARYVPVVEAADRATVSALDNIPGLTKIREGLYKNAAGDNFAIRVKGGDPWILSFENQKISEVIVPGDATRANILSASRPSLNRIATQLTLGTEQRLMEVGNVAIRDSNQALLSNDLTQLQNARAQLYLANDLGTQFGLATGRTGASEMIDTVNSFQLRKVNEAIERLGAATPAADVSRRAGVSLETASAFLGALPPSPGRVVTEAELSRAVNSFADAIANEYNTGRSLTPANVEMLTYEAAREGGIRGNGLDYLENKYPDVSIGVSANEADIGKFIRTLKTVNDADPATTLHFYRDGVNLQLAEGVYRRLTGEIVPDVRGFTVSRDSLMNCFTNDAFDLSRRELLYKELKKIMYDALATNPKTYDDLTKAYNQRLTATLLTPISEATSSQAAVIEAANRLNKQMNDLGVLNNLVNNKVRLVDSGLSGTLQLFTQGVISHNHPQIKTDILMMQSDIPLLDAATRTGMAGSFNGGLIEKVPLQGVFNGFGSDGAAQFTYVPVERSEMIFGGHGSDIITRINLYQKLGANAESPLSVLSSLNAVRDTVKLLGYQ